MKPTHEAFVVTGEGENAFWSKVGGVWPHDNGKGFNVELIALSFGGRLVIRERNEAAESLHASLTAIPSRNCDEARRRDGGVHRRWSKSVES